MKINLFIIYCVDCVGPNVHKLTCVSNVLIMATYHVSTDYLGCDNQLVITVTTVPTLNSFTLSNYS